MTNTSIKNKKANQKPLERRETTRNMENRCDIPDLQKIR